MRDIILNEFKKIDFEIKDEDLEPFIDYVNYNLFNIKPSLKNEHKRYFKVLFSIIKKNI
jgi:hypothetical protein